MEYCEYLLHDEIKNNIKCTFMSSTMSVMCGWGATIIMNMKYYSSHVGVHILIVCNVALFRHTFPTFKPYSMLSFSTSSSICGFTSKKWKWNSYAVENKRKTCWVRFSKLHYVSFCIYTVTNTTDITFYKCIKSNVSFISTLLRSKNILLFVAAPCMN